MIFSVAHCHADLCGNSDCYHYEYYEAETYDDVKRIFTPGSYLGGGWLITPIQGKPLPKVAPPWPKEPHR